MVVSGTEFSDVLERFVRGLPLESNDYRVSGIWLMHSSRYAIVEREGSKGYSFVYGGITNLGITTHRGMLLEEEVVYTKYELLLQWT